LLKCFWIELNINKYLRRKKNEKATVFDRVPLEEYKFTNVIILDEEKHSTSIIKDWITVCRKIFSR